MGCFGCCRPGKSNQRCFTVLVALAAAAILGCALWVLSASMKVKDNTSCIVDNFNQLGAEAPPGINSTISDEASGLVDQHVIDQVDNVLDWWMVSMIAPGAVSFGFLFLAAIFSCQSLMCGSACPPRLSKCFIVLGLIAGVVATVYFLLCASLGIAANFSSTSDAWHRNVEAPCDTMVSDFNNQLADANSTLTQCLQMAPSPATQCAEAARDYAYASKQLEAFTDFCSCASQYLRDAQPLAAPGISGSVLTILGMILSLGLCSTLACCRSYESAKADADFNGVSVKK